MRVFALIALMCLCGCSWFGWRKAHGPEPTQIVVTGAPKGSLIFIDDVQAGVPTAGNNRPQILDVAAGAHKVDIHMGASLVYHEDTYVGPGEHRVITVLSGFSR